MKSIRKPSFLRMLLLRSVALVLIFLCVSYTWIFYLAEKQRKERYNRFVDIVNYFAYYMQLIYDADSSEEIRSKIMELQLELDKRWELENMYISAYYNGNKIAETRNRAVVFLSLEVFEDEENYYIDGYPLELMDMSVLPSELMKEGYYPSYDDPVKRFVRTSPLSSYFTSRPKAYCFREFYINKDYYALPGMLQASDESTGDEPIIHVYSETAIPEDATVYSDENDIGNMDFLTLEDYVDLTPEDTSGCVPINKTSLLYIFYRSPENALTEDDVNYCYGYGNTSQVFDKTTRLYRLDKDADAPSDIYGSYYNFIITDTDTGLPATVTPFFPELDWSLKIAFDDDPSAFEMMPYTCITVYSLAVIIAFLTALVWTYFAYRRERHIWDILEFRRGAIEAMALDLKSPIEEISSSLKTLREGFTLDPEPHYNDIEQNTDTINRKIDNMLDFTHSESDSVTVEPEIVDLDSLVEQSIKDHWTLFSAASLKTDFKSSSLTIETDPKLFKQALDNLLSNCAHHADPNSTITINLTTTELTVSNKTSLEIKNANDLKKPFVKGENETGTGLGLSIVENDLRLLGYSLDLSLKDKVFTAKIKF